MCCIHLYVLYTHFERKKSFPDRPTVISVTGGTRNKELILDGPIKIILITFGKDIEGRRKRANLSGPGVSGQHGNPAKYAPAPGGVEEFLATLR